MTDIRPKADRPEQRAGAPRPAAGGKDNTGTGGLAQRASCQLGLVTRAQAIELRCSDRLLGRLCRSGQLQRMHRGVYRWTAVPRTAEQAALAACLATRGAMASGVTAMRLFGFEPGRQGGTGRTVHVTSGIPRHQPKSAGITVHRARALRRSDGTARHGVPVTSPVRTLVDSAVRVPAPVLERFIGHLLSTRAVSARQLELLLADLDRCPGRRFPGAARLRVCLERASVKRVPESAAEHCLLMLLRENALPEPVLQFRVSHGGRFLARVDGAYPRQRVAVEVDGYRWHSDPRTFRSDRRRANRLVEAGWTLLRTTVEELDEGAPDLLRQLRHFLSSPSAHTSDEPTP
jgi:very-short-patch-repair endonuclease